MPSKDFIGIYIISLSIIIAGLIIGGAVIFSGKNNGSSSQLAQVRPEQDQNNAPKTPPPKAEVSVDDDPFLGNEEAPVTVIEFSDFECPFCKRFHNSTLDQLISDYVDTGKIKFVYRDFPLTSIHPNAQKAAEAAECADDQGKFWKMHDLLFDRSPALSEDKLTNYAEELGLNVEQFQDCLASGKYADEVGKDFADGLAAGVNGTPTFFINGERLIGAQPFSAFQAIIDKQLEKSQ